MVAAMATGSQYGSFVFGGLFIGVWLYIAMFRTSVSLDINVGQWVLLGLVGLALAAALYGTRISNGGLRVGLFVLVGVSIGMLGTAFLLGQLKEGMATLITLVGGGLIVTALPAALHPQKAAAPQ
jgi:hypothetical protein